MFIVYSDSSMRDFNMKTAALEWERLGLRFVPSLTESGCFGDRPDVERPLGTDLRAVIRAATGSLLKALLAERLSVQLVGPIEEDPMTKLNVLAAVSALSTHGV
jgi:hypothetical protein